MRAPIAIAATAGALLLFPGSATAAPPANDNFANAQPITLGSTVDGTTAEATIEAGEPDYTPVIGPDAIASVWYAWNAGASPPEDVRFECGSEGGHSLRVYKGTSLGALTPVDDGNSFGCEQTFSPEPGASYRLAVVQFFPSPSEFELTARVLDSPANDDFGDAVTIPATLPQVVSGTTVDATTEPGEPLHAGSSGGSVWYSWSPTAAVRAKIDICDPDPVGGPAPAVAVYTGDAVGSLTEIARTGGPSDCTLSFDAGASTTYRIAISDFCCGGFDFEFELTLRQLQPPSNDDLAGAQPITGSLPQTVEGTLLDATHETGEPLHHSGFPPGPNFPDASVWYSWTAPAGGEFVVDSCDLFSGGFVIAVYTGSSYDGPDPLVAAAPNDGGCRQTFTASPATSYRIVVDGSRELPFEFEIRARNRPANDDLASATQIAPGVPRLAAGTTVDASSEPGEPSHGIGPQSSVWYRWHSGSGGPVTLSACSEQVSVMGAAVYSGTNYGDLSLVAGDVQRCLLHFTAAPNKEYRIAVDSLVVQGPFFLALWETDPPPNDAFDDAQPLTGGGPIAIEGTNFDATTEPGEPGHGQQFAERASVWYEWTAPASPATRTVNVDTCDSDFDSQVFVYTGTALGNLMEDAQGKGDCDPGNFPSGGRATFTALAGETYWIRVAGVGPQEDEGRFTLRLETSGGSTPPQGPSTGGGGTAPATEPPAEPKKCKKGKKLKKGKCVKKKRKAKRKKRRR